MDTTLVVASTVAMVGPILGMFSGVYVARLTQETTNRGKNLELITWSVNLVLTGEPVKIQAGLASLNHLLDSGVLKSDDKTYALGMLTHLYAEPQAQYQARPDAKIVRLRKDSDK